MHTKFILHGGCTSREHPSNETFFKECVKGLVDGNTLLHIPFARKTEQDEEGIYQRDKQSLTNYTDKKIIIEKANLETLAEQIDRASAIYVSGGKTALLKERLLTVPDLVSRIRGKLYCGSSAGANVLSMYHTSYFGDGVQQGLGILPICLMAHFGNLEFNAAPENKAWFDSYVDAYELLLLPECEWLVKEYNI